MKTHFAFLTLFFLLALAAGISACGASPAAPPEVTLAPESALPDFVRAMPPQVKEAYRFAIANPDTLQKIPCYCGCGAMGHKSNYNCYIKNASTNGQIDFDDHATGCSICVDITRDVMRLQREGKPLKEIRTYIDDTYSKYGPPTNTAPVASHTANCTREGLCGETATSESPVITLKNLPQSTVSIAASN